MEDSACGWSVGRPAAVGAVFGGLEASNLAGEGCSGTREGESRGVTKSVTLQFRELDYSI